MNTKHTPRPWYGSPTRKIPGATHSGRDWQVFIVNIDSGATAVAHGYSAEEAEANARLITAAPDLLAALKALVGTVPAGCRGGEWFHAVNTLRAAEGLPAMLSFDAAVEQYGHENLSPKAATI